MLSLYMCFRYLEISDVVVNHCNDLLQLYLCFDDLSVVLNLIMVLNAFQVSSSLAFLSLTSLQSFYP
jgi:hypothetical protein